MVSFHLFCFIWARTDIVLVVVCWRFETIHPETWVNMAKSLMVFRVGLMTLKLLVLHLQFIVHTGICATVIYLQMHNKCLVFAARCSSLARHLLWRRGYLCVPYVDVLCPNGEATLHRATLNRATVKRRQFTGRQVTAATDNRVPFNRATHHRAGSRHRRHHFIIIYLLNDKGRAENLGSRLVKCY